MIFINNINSSYSLDKEPIEINKFLFIRYFQIHPTTRLVSQNAQVQQRNRFPCNGNHPLKMVDDQSLKSERRNGPSNLSSIQYISSL